MLIQYSVFTFGHAARLNALIESDAHLEIESEHREGMSRRSSYWSKPIHYVKAKAMREVDAGVVNHSSITILREVLVDVPED